MQHLRGSLSAIRALGLKEFVIFYNNFIPSVFLKNGF